MELNINLVFNGQCEEAFRFYERCLGGKIVTMLTWADSPMANEAPEGWSEKILHATLKFGDNSLAGSDSFPGQYEGAKGFSILVSVEDPVEAERIFQALSENGTATTPLQKTFWAVLFGGLVDQFGIAWGINCEQAPA
jgi:PhnB protein